MSVQTQIDRIQQNVTDTYSALEEMGATMPTEQNSDNMAATVLTVPRGGGTSVQSDWNQTDETAADFIKNKPFGDELVEIIPLGDVEPVENEGAFAFLFETNVSIDDGNIVDVVWDGTKYFCPARFFAGMGTLFGNLAVFGSIDTGEPFIGVVQDGIIILMDVTATESVTREISISVVSKTPIHTDYLPYAITTFYINRLDGGDIYSDAACTVKVSFDEALNAIEKGFVCLYEAVEINRFVPLSTSVENFRKVFNVWINGSLCMYYSEPAITE